MTNENINSAKRNKNDEFYTCLTDIEKEVPLYKQYLTNKVIYCNCDDPRRSNFFKYFITHFSEFKIKKLITCCYKDQTPQLFRQKPIEKAIKSEYDGKTLTIQTLKGDGDFRSKESIDLLKKADIIITNPPFSLFREYIAQLIEYNKKFLIIGNINAISYKKVFPLIKTGSVWLGENKRCKDFLIPDDVPLLESKYRIDNRNRKVINLGNTTWYTNLGKPNYPDPIKLCKKYYGHESDYPRYDNYDAINIDKTKDIPCDYYGIMGVPISFIEKYNPDQFEILGFANTGEENKGIRRECASHGRALIKGKEKYVRIFIRRV